MKEESFATFFATFLYPSAWKDMNDETILRIFRSGGGVCVKIKLTVFLTDESKDNIMCV